MMGYLRSVMLFIVLSILVAGYAFAERTAYVVTTDYATGALSVIEPGANVAMQNVLSVHSDAVITSYGDYLYVIERFPADNITRIDPTNLSDIQQLSVGNGSNPQALAFLSDTKAYVTRNSAASLWIINPFTMEQIGEIDLAAYADEDGIPEMAAAAIVGDRLFVACQRLTDFTPANDSYIVVIDTATDQVVQTITLALRNPANMTAWDGKLYLSCPGDWFDPTDGGIEGVDLATLSSEGVVVSEVALEGNCSDVTVYGDHQGLVTVVGAWPNTFVKIFNPQTGTVGSELEAIAAAGGVYVDEGLVYVAEREFPGVVIFDAGTLARVRGPIDCGLPPSSIAFWGEKTTAVETENALLTPTRFNLGAAYPNPCNPMATIPFELDQPGSISLIIYDMLGQQVVTLSKGHIGAGRHTATWNGLNDYGSEVASGTYLIHLSTDSGVQSGKVLLMK